MPRMTLNERHLAIRKAGKVFGATEGSTTEKMQAAADAAGVTTRTIGRWRTLLIWKEWEKQGKFS